MFTASAFIRPSRVFMVKSRVKSTSPNNQFELPQNHKIQMTSTMCSTGFPQCLARYKFTKSCPHLPTMNSHPVLAAIKKNSGDIPQVCLESSNSLVFGGNFPGTISRSLGLDDCWKRPVVSFCLFLEQKEPKDSHHPQVSTVNIFPTQYFPQLVS